jgi:hypothetical protein
VIFTTDPSFDIGQLGSISGCPPSNEGSRQRPSRLAALFWRLSNPPIGSVAGPPFANALTEASAYSPSGRLRETRFGRRNGRIYFAPRVSA